ncbi:hypothetical protein SEUCBS140593_005097 [Sporothrix eucalyptigena]|uniref:Rho-GAP domain-containing protein n=1 Tax=Sporothrix eucalyptigena TaxID=1812306 RepID=A0ABP0BTM2_9PEZI
MPPSALPSRVVMEQPGPPAYAAWSRPGSDTNDGRPADRTQMGSSLIPDRRIFRGSATSWTSISSETDDPFANMSGSALVLPQQSLLLQEYNRLAEKRGLRPILYSEEDGDHDDLAEHDSQGDRRNWFARTFGRPSAPTSRRSSRHKRSDSDPTDPTPAGAKSGVVDTLKNQSLQTLVRICGKSFLYLPNEYATRSLMLPTCFRAAAQYLVQNGPETRGIFRVSGSMRVVNELYDYYCINLDDDEEIAATVRSPNLPFHIKAGVHDVASMFKRLLAGLPGGILGHLQLFEALVEIRRMDGHASNEVLESGRSDPTHIKARLIALAIGSVPRPLQRELMCSVFGLLAIIGHAAETADPVQATNGSSLPHSELMGYAALGIIFGPLLIGGLLDSYSPESVSSESSIPASPSAGPSFQSTPSPRSKTDKRRKSMASDKHSFATLPMTLDKILLANDVAEMLITNWRAVVYEMKHMGIMRKESMLQHPHQTRSAQPLSRSLRPSRSETFTDHDMGAMVQQASQLYSSNLRKTRSASNTRNPDGSTSVNQLPLSTTPAPQRPADMSFEEFAARKKLRNYASNMSIASDSTYSAIEPQPVKPLSPPVEDPFYIPGAIAISTRTGTAKLTKQRRASGGLSSIFSSDKSASPTKDLPKISRKAVASHTSAKSQGYDDTGKAASPWNRPWKVRGSPLVNGASPGPNALRGDSSPATRTSTTTKGLERQPSLLRSNKKGKPALTPQKKMYGVSTGTGNMNRVAGFKSGEKPARITTHEQRDADQLLNDAVSPLSEIKNDARGLTRGNSTSSRASKRTQTDGLDKVDAKSPAVQSSVKAMAAMFDTAAWKTTFDPSPIGQAHTTQTPKPQTPKRGSGLSLYTSNVSPSKAADFKTPPQSPMLPVKKVLDNFEGRGADTSALPRTPSARRRLRLTKSEGRNGPLGKVGRLAASERRELARSVDRNEMKDDLTRRSALGLTKSSDGIKDAQRGQQVRGRSDKTASTISTSSETTLATRRISKITQASDNDLLLVHRGVAASARSTGRPVSEVIPTGLSASVKELQRLLESKVAECEDWKTRAESAERRVADLESALAGNSGRSSYLGSLDETRIGSCITMTEQGNDPSLSWQSLVPETNSIHLSQEKLGLSSVVREIGVAEASPVAERTVSNLRKDFEMEDGTNSESSATVVVRGKLMNKQLLPFSM